MQKKLQQKPLKAVIFDFDGTLGDTLALCLEAAHRTAEPLLGRKVTDAEILATFGPSEEGAFRKLVPPELYETALEAYIAKCRELLAEYPSLFPGIREILDDLKRSGMILGLVTGRGKRTCDDALKFYGIFDLFDQIEPGIESGPSKPQGLTRILEHFGLSPEEAVYVGDAPSDVTACREVGIPILGAAWASTAETDDISVWNPNAVLHSVAELRAWLTARGAFGK
ncbi:MAG: HAD family hydrolase [Thermoguttaceae bacterium]|nr:HAD family hydrolase [Thermoguttaceae bacterium]